MDSVASGICIPLPLLEKQRKSLFVPPCAVDWQGLMGVANWTVVTALSAETAPTNPGGGGCRTTENSL